MDKVRVHRAPSLGTNQELSGVLFRLSTAFGSAPFAMDA